MLYAVRRKAKYLRNRNVKFILRPEQPFLIALPDAATVSALVKF